MVRILSSICRTNRILSRGFSTRVHRIIQEYGIWGIGVHSVVSISTFTLIYGLLESGTDLPHLLEERIGWTAPDWAMKYGNLAVSYSLYKLTFPLRIFITLSTTRLIRHWVQTIGRISKSK
jgi:hypothetical protein